MFLTLLVIGLAGLFVMALPAFGGHGHAHGGHGAGHGAGHGPAHVGSRAIGRGPAPSAPTQPSGASSEILAAHPTTTTVWRFLPSPRAICSVLALYGAFGNALVHAARFTTLFAALVALAPALIVEWLVVRPVWNLVFRFEGRPSTPLDALILAEATAVVPFRNGRGVISAVRDGRSVQLVARLRDDQASWPVKVGDRLQIEDVDAERERVTVTVLSVISGSTPLPR